MDNLSGHLTAKLAEKGEAYEKSLVDQINIMIKPPKPVTSDEVYIRAMYIVSDQINSQGGCFDPDEMERMMELLIDAPVMVGHKRDSLPVARNFKVERVEREGRLWLKSYFYWMKESRGAEDLRNNIDGGIYKECSVSFLFQLPECSICGQDIRSCRHVPFQEYDGSDGSREVAHFKYRRVEKVLETSLVFRGAVPDTSITDKLSDCPRGDTTEDETLSAKYFYKEGDGRFPMERFGFGRTKLRFVRPEAVRPDFNSDTVYAFTHQPGIMLRVTSDRGQIEFETGYLMPEAITLEIKNRLSGLKNISFVADVLLYATRGRERLNSLSLIGLFDKPSSWHRLRLKLYDLVEIEKRQLSDLSYEQRLAEANKKLNSAGNCRLDIVSSVRIDSQAEMDSCLGRINSYNFGLEALFEDEAGRLTRHIVRGTNQIPVLIKSSKVSNRSHLSCELEPLDNSLRSFNAIIPRAAGIERDRLLLIECSSSLSKPIVRHLKPIDLLPGYDRDEIELMSGASARSSGFFYCDNSDDRLTIVMEAEKERLKIVVHHFTEKLFGKGRRFIADVGQLNTDISRHASGQSVPLRSFIRQGGLISFSPGKGYAPFEGRLRIILRPVLIDGKQRYLFYADRLNDHQEGL